MVYFYLDRTLKPGATLRLRLAAPQSLERDKRQPPDRMALRRAKRLAADKDASASSD